MTTGPQGGRTRPIPLVHLRSAATMRAIEPDTVHRRFRLIEDGWTSSAVDRAVRRGRLVRLARGVYAAPPITPALRDAAAVQTCAGSVLSHESAARLRGIPLIGSVPVEPAITVPPRNGTHASQVRIHRATLDPCDVVEVHGLAATSTARTLVDLARHRSHRSAVVALDAALQRKLVTRSEVDDVVVRCWNWPGIRRAHRAVGLCDGRSESPLESISRLVLAWLGLPAPWLQTVVRARTSQVIARADFGWADLGVVGEADGLSKYSRPEILIEEKRRQEALESLGLVVVRWTWNDVIHRPFALRARIRQAFDRAERLRRSGFVLEASLSPSPPVG